jgi:hypothetical protein
MGQVPDDLDVEIPAIETEVGALRERTQQLVSELERRLRDRAARAKHTLESLRHVADVRAQLEERPLITIGISAATAIALGVGVWAAVTRWQRSRRPLARLRGRVLAYRALLAQPRRALHPREPVAKQLVVAALIAGATTIARGLSALLVKRTIEPRMLPPRQELELA